eukprot:2041042-Prymnesium_polylepis.1
MAAVRKSALALAVSSGDDRLLDLYPAVARPMMFSCATSMWGAAAWNQQTSDHYCRITRARLGLHKGMLPVPASSYPQAVFDSIVVVNASEKRPQYL